VRPADRSVVVDRKKDVTELFDVVLLDGSPRQLTLHLAQDIATESAIEVDGEQWIVADVRAVDGHPRQLICIHAL